MPVLRHSHCLFDVCCQCESAGTAYYASISNGTVSTIIYASMLAGVPWQDMTDDDTVDDGRDNFFYVLNNVIHGNHLPCPHSVEPVLPELSEVCNFLELDTRLPFYHVCMTAAFRVTLQISRGHCMAICIAMLGFVHA